jgi:hypothetical protein
VLFREGRGGIRLSRKKRLNFSLSFWHNPAMRLGKLQEFILVHTHLKIQGRLPSAWKSPNVWGTDEESLEFGKKRKKHFLNALLKSEVLLNYYDLEISEKPSRILGQTHFKYNKKYKNALTDLGRCLMGLEKIGLIEYGFTPTQIRLTRRGKETAEAALKKRQPVSSPVQNKLIS